MSLVVGPALIAESARWGDYRRDVDFAGDAELYTVEDHWKPFQEHMIQEYFPRRTEVYLQQLRDRELFPAIDAPVFTQHGEDDLPGFELGMSSELGTVLFTLDGTDPRSVGGGNQRICASVLGRNHARSCHAGDGTSTA